jgi:predicted nuclease of restriction endonuclease-like (RecB) superfamily
MSTREAAPTLNYIGRIKEILASARNNSLRAVNSMMVAAYWRIGREIVDEEQRGSLRADYGKKILEDLASRLIGEFGKGFSTSNLKNMRQFYLTYGDLGSSSHAAQIEKTQAPLSLSEDNKTQQPLDLITDNKIRQAVPSESTWPQFQLSWTHYCLLIRVAKKEAREFYEHECIQSNWSTRTLERQINSLLFERITRPRGQKRAIKPTLEPHQEFNPQDLIKDPYVLEFTGLPEPPHFTESELEEALITRLQHFLLELGKDIMFVARQKRITLDLEHYYIDLLFYHRELRCFLLIDLKTGKLTQQDVGQMLLYTGYYEKEVTRDGENPPIGLILCTEKNDAVVKYTLSDINRKIFAAKYQMHLPSVDELTEEIKRERIAIEDRWRTIKKNSRL